MDQTAFNEESVSVCLFFGKRIELRTHQTMWIVMSTINDKLYTENKTKYNQAILMMKIWCELQSCRWRCYIWNEDDPNNAFCQSNTIHRKLHRVLLMWYITTYKKCRQLIRRIIRFVEIVLNYRITSETSE